MTLRQPPLPTDTRSTQVSELLIIPLRIDLKRTRLYMLYRHYLGIHHSDYGFATMLLELAQDFILGVHHLYRELEEMREMGVIAYVCDAYEEEHRDVFYRRLREELWWVLDDLLGVVDGDGLRHFVRERRGIAGVLLQLVFRQCAGAQGDADALVVCAGGK